jgi:hypothetical protein
MMQAINLREDCTLALHCSPRKVYLGNNAKEL